MLLNTISSGKCLERRQEYFGKVPVIYCPCNLFLYHLSIIYPNIKNDLIRMLLEITEVFTTFSLLQPSLPVLYTLSSQATHEAVHLLCRMLVFDPVSVCTYFPV